MYQILLRSTWCWSAIKNDCCRDILYVYISSSNANITYLWGI